MIDNLEPVLDVIEREASESAKKALFAILQSGKDSYTMMMKLTGDQGAEWHQLPGFAQIMLARTFLEERYEGPHGEATKNA